MRSIGGPDLQIMGGRGPDPEGGGLKNIFSALRASVWSKIPPL